MNITNREWNAINRQFWRNQNIYDSALLERPDVVRNAVDIMFNKSLPDPNTIARNLDFCELLRCEARKIDETSENARKVQRVEIASLGGKAKPVDRLQIYIEKNSDESTTILDLVASLESEYAKYRDQSSVAIYNDKIDDPNIDLFDIIIIDEINDDGTKFSYRYSIVINSKNIKVKSKWISRNALRNRLYRAKRKLADRKRDTQ